MNIHAIEPWHRQEQERIGFLLGNKKCVLGEISQENYFTDAIVEVHADNLCNTITTLLANEGWKHIANRGHELFKNGKCVKTVNF